MAEKLVKYIIGLFGVSSSTLTLKYVIIFVISLMPILELRGGLIAASLLNRRFLGLDQEEPFLELSKNRREEINNPGIRYEYREKIMKYSDKPLTGIFEVHEDVPYYGPDLPIVK